MSLQGTIVPGRLRSELCPWEVKQKSFEISRINTTLNVILVWIHVRSHNTRFIIKFITRGIFVWSTISETTIFHHSKAHDQSFEISNQLKITLKILDQTVVQLPDQNNKNRTGLGPTKLGRSRTDSNQLPIA